MPVSALIEDDNSVRWSGVRVNYKTHTGYRLRGLYFISEGCSKEISKNKLQDTLLQYLIMIFRHSQKFTQNLYFVRAVVCWGRRGGTRSDYQEDTLHRLL